MKGSILAATISCYHARHSCARAVWRRRAGPHTVRARGAATHPRQSTLYTTIKTTQNVMETYNLAQRMATAPSSYYTAFSNMAQQTWTPGSSSRKYLRQFASLDQCGNNRQRRGGGEPGRASREPARSLDIARLACKANRPLPRKARPSIWAMRSTQPAFRRLARCGRTLRSVNRYQDAGNCQPLHRPNSTDRTCYVAAHQSGDALAAPHPAGSEPDDAGPELAADGAAEAAAGRIEDVDAGCRRVRNQLRHSYQHGYHRAESRHSATRRSATSPGGRLWDSNYSTSSRNNASH
jgi:hypothetical protein